jgi:hypothetical protein
MDTKLTNPKDLIGSGKVPLHLWPETASIYGCLGLLDGMLKYGRTNWRIAGVRASIYVDAARRHLMAWFEGEDFDPDSGLPHLCHGLACLAILVDAICANNLVDDRQVQGGYRKAITDLTHHVDRLKNLHSHRTGVKHYTIADNGLLMPTLNDLVGPVTMFKNVDVSKMATPSVFGQPVANGGGKPV